MKKNMKQNQKPNLDDELDIAIPALEAAGPIIENMGTKEIRSMPLGESIASQLEEFVNEEDDEDPEHHEDGDPKVS